MKIEFIKLQSHGDDRGSLISLEENINIPFTIKRVYYLFDTKKDIRRGFHAHKKLMQVVIALKGSCVFVLDDGKERKEIVINNPSEGLLIKSCMWREMYKFSSDCVLMVLASDLYNEDDYIRNYDEFIESRDL